jgi:hypothetical protein
VAQWSDTRLPADRVIRTQTSLNERRSQKFDSPFRNEERTPAPEWDDLMAESWSRLQSCCVVIEELSRHPRSAPGDLVSYDLTLSSVYVAIVALEACGEHAHRSRQSALRGTTDERCVTGARRRATL